MNLKEYQQEALKTWQDQPLQDKVKNAVLGLIGESGELADLNKKRLFHKKDVAADAAIKELGDICYYWAVLCHDLGLNIETVADGAITNRGSDTVSMMIWLDEKVSNIAVAVMERGYGAILDFRLSLEEKSALQELWGVILSIAAMHRISIGEVMWQNIAKLRERHGTQWSGGNYASEQE